LSKANSSLPATLGARLIFTGHSDAFEIPGFPGALTIASLPGMTIELFREFLSHHTGSFLNNRKAAAAK
jgi:hypothetical protein